MGRDHVLECVECCEKWHERYNEASKKDGYIFLEFAKKDPVPTFYLIPTHGFIEEEYKDDFPEPREEIDTEKLLAFVKEHQGHTLIFRYT